MGQRKVKRAVIYCRVSTDDQSCERQENDLIEYAQRADYEIVGIFKETASGAKTNRPQRQRVLDLVQGRKVDVVLVTELTRWGRSTNDLLDTLGHLQARNVSLIAQTGMEFDLSTPFGKLIATFMAGLATFERDLIRERVKSGIAAAKAKGQHHGRRKGTTTQKVAAVEAEILKALAQGTPYRKIASTLGVSKNTVLRLAKVHKG
jgi:DNA invertase Pin-like site-specific DNA recombinase